MAGPLTLYYSQAVLSDVPSLGYWRLNNNANDSITWSPHNGTVNDLITFGATGPVTDFDGINGSATFASSLNGISIANTAVIQPTVFSIEAWIFNTDNAPADFHTIMSLDAGSTMFIMSAGKKLELVINLTSGNQLILGNATLSLNTWTHVMGTFDGVDVATLYINGVLDKQTAGLAGTMSWSANTKIIGQRSGTNVNRGWFGRLYGIAWYPYCLSQQQALNHFNAATPAGVTVSNPATNLTSLLTNGGPPSLIDDDNYDFFDSDIPNQFNPFNNNIDNNNQDDSDPDSDSDEDGDNE